MPWGVVVLRSSTHAEFTDHNADASRDGQRVAAHDAIAWFDRFLAGDRDGTRRLFAERFDDSADRSSIGTGTGDAGPATVRITSGRRVVARLGRRADLGSGQEVVVRLERSTTQHTRRCCSSTHRASGMLSE